MKHFHAVVLSDRRHSYIHKYESNASMLSRVIFYLKSVTFLFLFSIVKLGFTGVYIKFRIFALKHRLWVLVITEAVLTCTHNPCFDQK